MPPKNVSGAAIFWLAVCALAMAQCPGSAWAQQDDWNQVIAAAKKEGKLVLYTAFTGQKSTKDITDAFEKKYGIAVDVLEARASEIRERVRVEQSAGRFAADVMFTSEGQTKLYDREDKTVAPLPMTPARAGVKTQFILPVPMAAVMSIPYGILINTNLVKAADEPKSWADVADPKWKGKILADDTRAAGGGYLWYFVTYGALGEAFHHKVAANGPIFTRDQRESQRRIARGEFALYLPLTLPDSLALKGLPVKAIMPTEGAPYVLYGNIVLKNAPHPNAAKLYLDFLQTRGAQLVYARLGHGYVIDGIENEIPGEARAISGVKLLGTTDPDRQTEMIELARRIYK
jgi:iron(III) transport system substrate-binding protein